jgi:hypothetical protein
VAAKHRRSAENKEFTDLSKLLPLQQQIAAQLDKASIIRLTISYLRLHEFLSQGDPAWPTEVNGKCEQKRLRLRTTRIHSVPSKTQALNLFKADEASQLLQVNSNDAHRQDEPRSFHIDLHSLWMVSSSH